MELKNIGTEPVDCGRVRRQDSDDSRDEEANDFGFGGDNKTPLYLADRTMLVDETSWGRDHATYTWGRRDEGTGAFVQAPGSTKNEVNECRMRPTASS